MEKTDKKRRFRKTKKKSKQKRKNLTKTLVFCTFTFSLAFYCFTKILLVSYNIKLAEEEQDVQSDIYLKEESIEELQSEMRSIKNKKRLLGMLDDDELEDNENNIYFMGNRKTE